MQSERKKFSESTKKFELGFFDACVAKHTSKTKTSPKINEKTQKSYSFFISIRQKSPGEDRTRIIFSFILFEQNTKKEETKASLPYS